MAFACDGCSHLLQSFTPVILSLEKEGTERNNAEATETGLILFFIWSYNFSFLISNHLCHVFQRKDYTMVINSIPAASTALLHPPVSIFTVFCLCLQSWRITEFRLLAVQLNVLTADPFRAHYTLCRTPLSL